MPHQIFSKKKEFLDLIRINVTINFTKGCLQYQGFPENFGEIMNLKYFWTF